MKILMTILSVMLVIVIVFTTFGISMRDSSGQLNFFTAFGKIENAIGDFSKTTMDIYHGVKDFITEISPSFSRLLSTIKNILLNLDEKFGIIDKMFGFIESIQNLIRRIFMSIDIFLNFISEYGFYINDNIWWSKLSFSLNCRENPEYYISDDKFNYDKLFKVLRAYFDGEINEYTYIFESDKSDNISKNDDFINANFTKTYIFYSSFYFWLNNDLSIEDFYYLQTIDIVLPDDYMPYLDDYLRITHYCDEFVFPVGDSDITYTIDNRVYYLNGVTFKSMEGLDLFDTEFAVRLYDCDFALYFEFLYVDDDNGYDDYISVSANEYFKSVSSGFKTIQDVHIYDGLLWYDDGYKYSSGTDFPIDPLPE